MYFDIIPTIWIKSLKNAIGHVFIILNRQGTQDSAEYGLMSISSLFVVTNYETVRSLSKQWKFGDISVIPPGK